MARLAIVVLPGVVNHVTQRGVRSMDIFYSDKDRKEYLFLLNQHAEKAGLKFVSYCLMTNHVHLLVIPTAEESLR
jgi:putative transposase